MVVFPNAKINLGLNVRYKRDDGFHELETIMLPVPMVDILEILPADKTELFESGITLKGTPMEQNLIYKAWSLLKTQYDIPAIKIYLHKKIPSGAGLGGGSADAAFAIRALNEMFELNLSPLEMKKKAAMLGSDCAFFIENEPALATGRGEKLEPVQVDLKGKYLLLVVPGLHVSTAEAYGNIKPHESERLVRYVVTQPANTWQNDLINDFEASIFPVYPELKNIKENLYAHGAFYAAMSGSGSAIYGLFNDEPEPFFYPNTRLIKILKL
ncbi:4-diphosphocytidyl-2-C-methyl-D-erythritol kinase [Salinivirga cyanobacteriivorans]|uniref:4-diphosphocytidyl-2-C-methyl-D-erythritol kinase n=1 Tax=Salinivirga cyanobacteriivorans TaxID=1307839 RepID=A0A0S2I3R9_9BACT|nr:4-(cytidine 5'-diphospho)-2-C-methyl-D-erythritol kinase [Salinivirga cyanobacteriivorans]ALO16961.1 4-diphosphocytidyl-2-C-methyl-D-erythritol kinase [Salinivirga cyanobacteriivorans]